MPNLIQRSEPRSIKFTPHINPYCLGSVLVEFGQTKVHITVSLEDKVPPFLQGKGEGWLSAEYSLLPGSTHTRKKRERSALSGRTQEIQRLIGRSLRSALDFKKLGERALTIDCDVLIADGGTRTASISGAYVALELAIQRLLEEKRLAESPLIHRVGAISVGVTKEGKILADLDYNEDSSCETDMNIVMTDQGEYVEVQGCAEGVPFTIEQFNAMLDCAKDALQKVFAKQKAAVEIK